MKTKYLKVKTPAGTFTISNGNSKVKFPIINTGAALDCPSRKWCPFDQDNNKAAGRNLCYAQKTEKLRPSVLQSRRMNEAIIDADPITHGQQIAEALLGKLSAKRGRWNFDTVRINESGDLSSKNIGFIEMVSQTLQAAGVKVYLYSKAKKSLRDRAAKFSTVLHSERDFVAFKDDKELTQSGAQKCSGICGPCRACPDFAGGKIGILEH